MHPFDVNNLPIFLSNLSYIYIYIILNFIIYIFLLPSIIIFRFKITISRERQQQRDIGTHHKDTRLKSTAVLQHPTRVNATRSEV